MQVEAAFVVMLLRHFHDEGSMKMSAPLDHPHENGL